MLVSYVQLWHTRIPVYTHGHLLQVHVASRNAGNLVYRIPVAKAYTRHGRRLVACGPGYIPYYLDIRCVRQYGYFAPRASNSSLLNFLYMSALFSFVISRHVA